MITTHKFSHSFSFSQFSLQYKRLLLPITLLALVGAETTREITVTTLSDAFWAVSTYVAFTLVIYHYLSNIMGKTNRITALYNKSRTNQVVFSSLLGALPGCGGAIVVTTQYISGKVGFGSVVAVLTATMGDAAFLLIAAQPKVGFGVMALGVVVGAISGIVVNALHKDDFLRPETQEKQQDQKSENSEKNTSCLQVKAINLQGVFWKWVLIPATVIALLGSFQLDINQLFHLPQHSIEWIGAILAIGSMMLWSLTKEISDYQSTVSEDNKCVSSHPMQKAAQDTNFVSAWVIVAFLIFELSTYFSGIDLHTVFLGYGMWMPLIGLAIGLLPGCGPQILVTSLYLSGAMPMSAQLSNAISNDGDALFPAIALAPKAAMLATFYSAVPAFVVGYGYYFLFEM
ncbi:putative manganese transporter [Aliivibrio sp. S4TY2]|uniref:putative manganese transporter n=1 Tax=unclassified Aliivibrio TaxID=2645654 RepID=UPI002378FE94|nr:MULTISPECIES: putative manganese transporter [unclassified Aliivibrio]MDD9156219.1 putative manganese transporter [Aliivibrio sp. S4TY2]MDD9160566.1 putative manganese transporter [Aliivibrio sp. S4TY1]MDD9163927.1 putative manganese transporter [Aliivibrio sp. S4MY2]MDD9168098.1 putative manganese transporter [Aliivibrio sp. S4MY4]MDD9185123.1 putative manganese transporter [Aliivibrio sp. S4MY3]